MKSIDSEYVFRLPAHELLSLVDVVIFFNKKVLLEVSADGVVVVVPLLLGQCH